VDSAALEDGVRSAFAGWRRAPAALPTLAAPERLRDRRVLLVDSPDSVQTYFWIANVGVAKRYPARAALDLVNTLYGGRFTSLLNTELRIKSGLSYGARSGFALGRVAGEFSIRSFAQTENTGKAVDLALHTLTRLKQERVTQEMLDSARAYLLGQFPLAFETAADWAVALADLELYGLGPEDIDGYGAALGNVTLRDAWAVIDEAFPSPQSVAIVLVGDAGRIRGQVGEYGPVTEMELTLPTFDAADAASISYARAARR
jgi:predicted Zn-dependent peptidase